MSESRCVLCNQPTGDDYQTFTLTPEARAFYEQRFQGTDLNSLLAAHVICARCRALSAEARSALARDAIARELSSYVEAVSSEEVSKRIDVGRTIDSVPLTDETWEWLNLLGFVLVRTQAQARVHEANTGWFSSGDDYKRILVPVIAKDINTLGAIFMAIRCEWTHQAAALVRSLCESLITLRYIAQDKAVRPRLFLDYAVIEQYRAMDNLLKWDSEGAKPEHVAQMEALKATISLKYEMMRPKYTFTDRLGKERPFSNWCNKRIAEMAVDTSSERLYRLIYAQTSPYVHGSAWSLRTVPALSARGYDPRTALLDTATLIRATLAVWLEWAVFCDRELDWELSANLGVLKERVDELQARLDATGDPGRPRTEGDDAD